MIGGMSDDLTTVPNVGPAVAAKLRRLGISRAAELRGRDPEELYDRLCELENRRHDLCLLDTFTAAVSFADGEPARPWWEFSRARARPRSPLGRVSQRPEPSPADSEQGERNVGRNQPISGAERRYVALDPWGASGGRSRPDVTPGCRGGWAGGR